MAGIDPREFEIEFIERTQIILRDYRGPYEFSLLINCLLSLVVLICERIKVNGSKEFQVQALELPQLQSVISDATFVFDPVSRRGNPQPKTLENFVKRMRNAIAHGAVYPETGPPAPDPNSKWTAVYLEAYNDYAPGKPPELDARFTYEALRDFALFISTLYQKEFLGM